MELVVDTNILLAALLKPSTTQQLLFSEKLRLYVPEHCLEEIEKYSSEFARRMGKSEKEFGLALAIIFSQVTIVSAQEYVNFKKQALEMLTDEKDWPFLALALAKHIPIWSNDKGFKQQSAVKVFSTKELLAELRLL